MCIKDDDDDDNNIKLNNNRLRLFIKIPLFNEHPFFLYLNTEPDFCIFQ